MLSQRPVKCSPERGPKLTDIAQIIVGLCTDSATSPLSTCTYALHAAGIKRYRVMPMKAQGSLTRVSGLCGGVEVAEQDVWE